MLTTETISLTQVVSLAVAGVLCICLPVAAAIYWCKTRRARIAPLFVGMLTFILFAQVLESALHYVCLLSDNAVSRAIGGSTVLYMLYGALAAGVFEETGRYVAFRTLLRRYPERDAAVTYGIGHGGWEAIQVVGISFVLYAMAAQLVRSGNLDAVNALLSTGRGGASVDSAQQLEQLLGLIREATPLTCALSVAERIFAMLLHIALSIFVFVAARDKTKRRYVLLAIVLHAVADAPVALGQRGVLPGWAVELWIAVFALWCLRAARKRYLELLDA